jgi:N-acetylglucosaminyldiphosphoundecaprenol N-acetyl-beta-D-mannosaminyltransferase
MYLRYREPVWDTVEVGTAPQPRAGSRATSRRRRDLPGSSPRPSGQAAHQSLPVIQLNGVKLHAVNEAQVITHILTEIENGQGGVVVTPNLDHLRRYCHDLTFGALIAEADLIVADGMPLVWASRLQGTPLPERVPGSNLISSLTAKAGICGRSVFLLGGDAGTAAEAAIALKQKHPTSIIAGTHFPPFGFQDDPKQMSIIIQALSDVKPDIVYVALGSPKQEKLIARLREILPNAWWIGVGNSFSFLAGRVRRAPVWMQTIGMEWAHRLCQEPKRLFRRYLIVGIPFATSLLARSTARGLGDRVRALVPGGKPRYRLTTPDGETKAAQSVSQPPSASPISRPRIETPAIMGSALMPPRALSGLRAMVLLGGSVRSNQLSSSTGRSILDLPLDGTGTILTHWLSHAHEIANWAGLSRLPVRVMVNQSAPAPLSADARHYTDFRVERDLSDYRGTGGVLHDLAEDYDDEDLLLIGNAAQVLLDPLPRIAAELHRKKADVALVSHDDGTPSGLMLVSCKALRMIAPRGFVDMKEQALPLIASKYDVRVVQYRRPTGLPVRSLSDYVQALRFHHRHSIDRPADPLAEDWSPTFSIIENGATVDASARLHDSVVLRGARVEAGAVVVRSIVCPNSSVSSDQTAVDRVVMAGSGESRPQRRRRHAVAR